MSAFPVQEIEKKLGYVFKDKKLLQEAFTHSSYANRYGGRDNERLEYLGDAVLQLVVTEWQYLRDEQASEGKLTAKRQKLVCRDALDSAVDGLDIFGDLLTFGSEYNVRGKAKSSLFEAVTAAIYLDGGYPAAKKFIERHGNIDFDVDVGNPKGDLKEFLEKRGFPQPEYKLVEKTGKDNAPMFKYSASALGSVAIGDGRSRREAESTAASRLLLELEGREKTEGAFRNAASGNFPKKK